MKEERFETGSKYFIFKIQDLVNNSFHTLEEKRMESLLQYIEVCISTYEELRMSLDESKLKRSYESLLEGLDYQMQKHPFHNLDLYIRDFSYLHQLIQQNGENREREMHNIHRNLVALKKKLETENIIQCYIKCIRNNNSFQEIDYLIEALVSDLLKMGYSMTYICNFFKKQQQDYLETNDANQVIDNLSELDKAPKSFMIHICFNIKSQTQKELALNLLKRRFRVRTSKEVDIEIEHIPEDTFIASKEYSTYDEFAAIAMARKDFKSTTELFEMWQGSKNCIKDNLWYFWQEGDFFGKTSLNNIDNRKMLSYIDTNYKKQMERFLKLNDDIVNDNTKTLERVLVSEVYYY